MTMPRDPSRREMLLAAAASMASCATRNEAAEPTKENGTMNPEQASQFAKLALKGIQTEYPNKPGDVLNNERDIKGPRAMHPAFYGCFD